MELEFIEPKTRKIIRNTANRLGIDEAELINFLLKEEIRASIEYHDVMNEIREQE